MRKMKHLILIIISGVMAGCSFMPWSQEAVEPVEVITIAQRPPMWHPPLPIEMQMQTVEFEVFTPELMQEYLDLVVENKAPPIPYYALTTQQYENLAINMAEIKRYITNILSIVKFYREYENEENPE